MPRSSPKRKHASSPLPNAKHEAFAIAVCNGAKLQDAYNAAGFKGKANGSAWTLRHQPHLDARVQWVLNERVKADSRAFVRRQKSHTDMLDAAVKRLADLAMTDPRELFAWRNEAQLNAAGEVTGVTPRLMLRDSLDISPAAASLIKGAFVKAGEIKLETHDQRAALVDLVKILKGNDIGAGATTTNVTQINVGGVSALDAAQRVAFLLASMASRAPSAPIIDAHPVHISQDTDTDPER